MGSCTDPNQISASGRILRVSYFYGENDVKIEEEIKLINVED